MQTIFMVVKQKTHIKHLSAYKPFKVHGNIDILILTDDNRCIEYSLVFRQNSLTRYIGRKLRSLFEPYFIDKHTDIVVNDLFDEYNPLYQYFMNLRQHIGFRMMSVDIDKVISRIHYYYFKKKGTKSNFNKVWKRVIESKQCPWITQEVEYALQNKGSSTANRIRTSRLMLFYIVVKNYLYRLVLKSLMKTKSMAV